MSQFDHSFLFVTASTGGHVFPMVSVAKKLQTQGYEINWIISGTELEKKILNQYGFKYSVMPVGRLRKGVSFLERIVTILLIPCYFIYSLYLLRKYKPSVVLSAGGSVSGPVILIASLFRFKTAVWELNAVSGFTNKILSRFVEKIFICFDEVISYYPEEKCVRVNFPVRSEIVNQANKKREPDGYLHVFIVGGSQGAHQINKAILNMVHNQDMRIFKIKHQTGKKDFQTIQSIYKEKINVECRPFYFNIGEVYHWSDVVVCRGGASTLAEVATIGKAAIIIPLPTAVDNHQLQNTLSLYNQEAVEKLEEHEMTGEKLYEKILSISGLKKKTMEQKIKQLYGPKEHLNIESELISWVNNI